MTDKKPEKESQKEKKSAKASPKLTKLIDEIEKLTVIELAELVKALEDKFGVSAIPAAAPTAAAPTASGNDESASEDGGKSEYDVILTDAGDKKINTIKAVREINQGLGLKEAKELVEATPKAVLEKVNEEDAKTAKAKLEEAGAKVELK